MSWERIRGHEAVRDTLRASLRRGRLGQAYFLVGPSGIGKSTFARELAKALLCERPPDVLTACDRCDSCHQVEANTHPDVIFARTPEDKHELPIDEMRDFCAQLARTPARGGRRVGIVEDADDFNLESANCFLKSLEEPPSGTVLLLIGTSIDRQLPTVLSRCQILRFNPLSPKDLAAILQAEGVSDPKMSERLVGLAGGSVSRALALNDDAIWSVRKALLEGITSDRPDFVHLVKLCSECIEGVGKETAPQRERASVLIGFMIQLLRQCLRLALGATVIGLDLDEERRLSSFAHRLGPDKLMELIDKCLEADYRVERRVQLILVLEALLDPFAKPQRV